MTESKTNVTVRAELWVRAKERFMEDLAEDDKVFHDEIMEMV